MSGRQALYISIIIILIALGMTSGFARDHRSQAPELRAQGWVDTIQEPTDLTLGQLRGRVVVLLFFIADDNHSVIALEQASRLWEAYRYQGLQIIGVHSPPKGWEPAGKKWRTMTLEDSVTVKPTPVPGIFSDNNRHSSPPVTHDKHERANLKERAQRRWQRQNQAPLQELAMARRLPFPILLDHDRYVWTKYRIHAYPTFQVIGADGALGPRIVGSKAYQEVSRAVDALLQESSRH